MKTLPDNLKPLFFTLTRTHSTRKEIKRGVAGVELLPAKPTETLSPLIAISPESGIETLPPDTLNDLEADLITSVHRLCIPWIAVKPNPTSPEWNQVELPDLALAREALFRIGWARLAPCDIARAVSSARAVERLTTRAEAFEASSKAQLTYRTAYSCAAVLYGNLPAVKVGTLFDSVSEALHHAAEMPTKTAFAKWFERWPYRLK